MTDGDRFPAQLFLLEVASGRWRTAVTFDAAVPSRGSPSSAWPAGALAGRVGTHAFEGGA